MKCSKHDKEARFVNNGNSKRLQYWWCDACKDIVDEREEAPYFFTLPKGYKVDTAVLSGDYSVRVWDGKTWK